MTKIFVTLQNKSTLKQMSKNNIPKMRLLGLGLAVLFTALFVEEIKRKNEEVEQRIQQIYLSPSNTDAGSRFTDDDTVGYSYTIDSIDNDSIQDSYARELDSLLKVNQADLEAIKTETDRKIREAQLEAERLTRETTGISVRRRPSSSSSYSSTSSDENEDEDEDIDIENEDNDDSYLDEDNDDIDSSLDDDDDGDDDEDSRWSRMKRRSKKIYHKTKEKSRDLWHKAKRKIHEWTED